MYYQCHTKYDGCNDNCILQQPVVVCCMHASYPPDLDNVSDIPRVLIIAVSTFDWSNGFQIPCQPICPLGIRVMRNFQPACPYLVPNYKLIARRYYSVFIHSLISCLFLDEFFTRKRPPWSEKQNFGSEAQNQWMVFTVCPLDRVGSIRSACYCCCLKATLLIRPYQNLLLYTRFIDKEKNKNRNLVVLTTGTDDWTSRPVGLYRICSLQPVQIRCWKKTFYNYSKAFDCSVVHEKIGKINSQVRPKSVPWSNDFCIAFIDHEH